MTDTSRSRHSGANRNPETNKLSRVIDELWLRNESEMTHARTPEERAFLLGKKEALGEVSGKLIPKEHEIEYDPN